jgi:hypothetical protein
VEGEAGTGLGAHIRRVGGRGSGVETGTLVVDKNLKKADVGASSLIRALRSARVESEERGRSFCGN